MASHTSRYLCRALDNAIKWEASLLDSMLGTNKEFEDESRKFLAWARAYRAKRWGKLESPFNGAKSVELKGIQNGDRREG